MKNKFIYCFILLSTLFFAACSTSKEDKDQLEFQSLRSKLIKINIGLERANSENEFESIIDSIKVLKSELDYTNINEVDKLELNKMIDSSFAQVESQREKVKIEIAEKNKFDKEEKKNKIINCLTSTEWNRDAYDFGFYKGGNGYYRMNNMSHKNRLTWKYKGGDNVIVYIPYLADDGMVVTVQTNGCMVYFPF